MLDIVLAVPIGAGATYVYFLLFNKTIDLSHRLSVEMTPAVILLSYFARLMVVAGILAIAVLILKANAFLTAVSFLVIYTMALLFNERRLIMVLTSGRLLMRKE